MLHPQRKTMDLVPLVCLCLLTWSAGTAADHKPVVVNVEPGRDVILPCSLSTQQSLTFEFFEWKKDQKQVFLYDAGTHSNNHPLGQDEQFKGRVFHFKDQLKNGIASIEIRNTQLDDIGDYTCDFPRLQPPQTFYIKLVVEPVVVYVEPGSDVVLPCSLSTQQSLTYGHFEWKKDQKQVFKYDEGSHSNNVLPGQDEQFKGRVFHLEDQLKNGSASIKINNTQLADSGIYICDFPRLQPPQTFHIKLFVVEPVVVNVEPGSDVILPCSLSTQQSLTFEFFEWKKYQKQVFFYDEGTHSNNNPTGQDEQFKGRVFHLEDQVKNGIASIKIRNTTIADSGDYTCDFPRLQPPQTFYIKLVVDPDPQRKILKDRSDKNIGAAKPYVKLVKTDDGVLLQCEVKGASSQPKVEWKDSAGNILPAEEPQVTERGGSYDVILQATVTKTDIFTCVYTEEDNNHQISDWTYAALNGAAVKPSVSLVKTDDGMVLQCVVRGASPQPKVEWKDSAGNILPAKELPADKGSYDVILQAPLTKTDTFTCVVTQEELNHQISDWTYAGPLNGGVLTSWGSFS